MRAVAGDLAFGVRAQISLSDLHALPSFPMRKQKRALVGMQTEIQENLAGWERGHRGADIPTVSLNVLLSVLFYSQASAHIHHSLNLNTHCPLTGGKWGWVGYRGGGEEMPWFCFLKTNN